MNNELTKENMVESIKHSNRVLYCLIESELKKENYTLKGLTDININLIDLIVKIHKSEAYLNEN